MITVQKMGVQKLFNHPCSLLFAVCAGIPYRILHVTPNAVCCLQFVPAHHTVSCMWPHRQMSRGGWSGDLAGQTCGPQWPIQQTGYWKLRHSVTGRLTRGGTRSCSNDIRNLVSRGMSCSKSSSGCCISDKKQRSDRPQWQMVQSVDSQRQRTKYCLKTGVTHFKIFLLRYWHHNRIHVIILD